MNFKPIFQLLFFEHGYLSNYNISFKLEIFKVIKMIFMNMHIKFEEFSLIIKRDILVKKI